MKFLPFIIQEMDYPQTQTLEIIPLQIIYNYITISMKALVLHLQTSPPIVIMAQLMVQVGAQATVIMELQLFPM